LQGHLLKISLQGKTHFASRPVKVPKYDGCSIL
jgi:hypothetical protein